MFSPQHKGYTTAMRFAPTQPTHAFLILALAVFSLITPLASQLNAQADTGTFYVPDTTSAELYKAAHAVWLPFAPNSNRSNVAELLKHLSFAEKQHRTPAVVSYFIPDRDLGQASSGGQASLTAYMAEHDKIRRELQRFKARTNLTPLVILEPDALAQSWSFIQAYPNDEQALFRLKERLHTLSVLVQQYRSIGCKVYLDAGHSDWFVGQSGINGLADLLTAAGATYADGFTSNISSRQWVSPEVSGFQRPWWKPWKNDPYSTPERTELPFATQVLKALQERNPQHRGAWEWVVDISRSGGNPMNRVYTLDADGSIITKFDGKRMSIGKWRKEADGLTWLYPYFGRSETINSLVEVQQYKWNAGSSTLTAPLWLDAENTLRAKVKPADVKTAGGSIAFKGLFIKPADECDGALGLPPGESRNTLMESYQKLQ
jgi:hypothetical protein